MTVLELIYELQKMNPKFEVVLDVDDGLSGNYLEVTQAFPSESDAGVNFVILKH